MALEGGHWQNDRVCVTFDVMEESTSDLCHRVSDSTSVRHACKRHGGPRSEGKHAQSRPGSLRIIVCPSMLGEPRGPMPGRYQIHVHPTDTFAWRCTPRVHGTELWDAQLSPGVSRTTGDARSPGCTLEFDRWLL